MQAIYRIFKKIPWHFVIAFRAVSWLFFSPNPRRFANVWITYKAGGLHACFIRAIDSFSDINRTYRPCQNELTSLQSEYLFSQCSRKPLISILLPLSDATSANYLKKSIISVQNQHYKNFELIFVQQNDYLQTKTKNIIESTIKTDNRFYLCHAPLKTPGARLNCGLKKAIGQFITFLNPYDELSPDALSWFTWTLNSRPDAVWFYSDEDRVSSRGKYSSPNFKPDFSAEFLLSFMFTGNMSVYSIDILSKVNRFSEKSDLDIHQDIALRLSEILSPEEVVHIPRILYHRHRSGLLVENRSAPETGSKAVWEAMARRRLKGQVTTHKLCPTLHQIKFEPVSTPKVSILIPTRNYLKLLKRCIASLRKHTRYDNYEIVIIDNHSDDPALHQYLHREQSENYFNVISYDKPFNHSDMNNLAVRSVDSEFVVFMNNDIEIVSDNWLEQFVATMQIDKSIACVGALLLYPDGTVQHGGMIMGIRGIAGHAHKYMRTKTLGYNKRLFALQELSGITSALSLVRTSSFKQVSGYNAERYPTSFNDVDLCIRLRKHGFRCIYNPMIRAIHYESKSRPITTDEFVFQKRLVEEHLELLQSDRFYNPNLTLENEQFAGFRDYPVELQFPELVNFKTM